MKKLLITGAGGFVGKSLVQHLAESENLYEAYALSHNEMDLTKREDVEKTIARILPDKVIHLAAISSIGKATENPDLAIGVNVCGTANLLESIRKYSPFSKCLIVGSSEQYAASEKPLAESDDMEPRNIYGYTKLWQEQLAQWYVRKYHSNIICVRSFNQVGIYQSTQTMMISFCKQIADVAAQKRSENVIYTGNLDIERDISDVRDVISAYILLLESNITSEIFNICSGKALRLSSLLEKIISYSGIDIKVQTDPQRVRKGELRYICGDNSKLKRATGWTPKYGIDETIAYIYSKTKSDELQGCV